MEIAEKKVRMFVSFVGDLGIFLHCLKCSPLLPELWTRLSPIGLLVSLCLALQYRTLSLEDAKAVIRRIINRATAMLNEEDLENLKREKARYDKDRKIWEKERAKYEQDLKELEDARNCMELYRHAIEGVERKSPLVRAQYPQNQITF